MQFPGASNFDDRGDGASVSGFTLVRFHDAGDEDAARPGKRIFSSGEKFEGETSAVPKNSRFFAALTRHPAALHGFCVIKFCGMADAPGRIKFLFLIIVASLIPMPGSYRGLQES